VCRSQRLYAVKKGRKILDGVDDDHRPVNSPTFISEPKPGRVCKEGGGRDTVWLEDVPHKETTLELCLPCIRGRKNYNRTQLPGPESRLSARPHILNRNSIEAHENVMPEASNTALRVRRGTYWATYGRNHKRRRISFPSLQGCDCAAKDAVTISVRTRPKVGSSESDSWKCSKSHTTSRIRATGKARTRAFDRLELMCFHSYF
jgi:hypothetical protein